jgi:hypothetical protein
MRSSVAAFHLSRLHVIYLGDRSWVARYPGQLMLRDGNDLRSLLVPTKPSGPGNEGEVVQIPERGRDYEVDFERTKIGVDVGSSASREYKCRRYKFDFVLALKPMASFCNGLFPYIS